MRIFGSDRMDGMLQRLGLKEGEAIVHPWINKALEKAQQKVEARNFDIRKHLLKYDDVMNDQRKVVYEQRREIMSAERRRRDGRRHARRDDRRRWSRARIPENALRRAVGHRRACTPTCLRVLDLDLPIADWAKEEGIDRGPSCASASPRRPTGTMAEKAANFGADLMRIVEKSLLLQFLDHDLEGPPAAARPSAPGHRPARLRPARPAERVQARGLRAVRGHADQPAEQVSQVLAHLEIRTEEPPPPPPPVQVTAPAKAARVLAMAGGDDSDVNPADPSTWGRVQRNAPCPCGSGRKYKQCHGRLAEPAGLLTFTLRAGPARRMIERTNCSAPGMP